VKASLERRLIASIERTGLIQPGDRLGVAVSGGADSVALLRVLAAARECFGITLAVLHFDHALRPESAEDAKFVKELARSLGAVYIATREDVAAVAARKKWNLEDAARRLRYEFFTNAIREDRVSRVAVAHTMDDQAETVLARMLRGTGPAGLSGIRPSAASGTIVRPLLDVRRAELRTYLRGIGQDWREDATNRDTSRQRARIRERLLPLLVTDFSPRAVERLASLAALAQEESDFWRALTEDRYISLATQGGAAVSIPIVKLLSPLPLAVVSAAPAPQAQRSLTERLIRRLYEGVRGDRCELAHAHVAQVIRLCERAASGKRIELPGGVTASREFGTLTFSRRRTIRKRKAALETQSGRAAYQYAIDLLAPGATDVSIPELGTCFRLKVIDWSSPERETTMWRNLLDFDRVRPPLVLRNWRPGDAYRPTGRRKSHKLKEMFLSARVAAGERFTWPVLESDGRVIWAKGFDPAHDVSVQADTRVGLLIEERKL
jgi:tRNA(Ile)-lysidine synthase